MTNKQKFDRLRKLLDEASVYARAIGTRLLLCKSLCVAVTATIKIGYADFCTAAPCIQRSAL